MDEAFVSLATNDNYACGAEVLGRSLKRSGTQRKCVLMVTSGISSPIRDQLNQVWDELVEITALDSNDQEKLAILARPELGCTFSKLRAWTLTQYKKCVFLDADTLVLQNVDELFEREELSAAPDIGWPDCFNSGVFVFKPSLETYNQLLEHAKKRGSFDGGDQGLLNDFFKDWPTKDISTHLPFVYNMVANICYSYSPAFMRFGQDVKIVHFLGSVKPWHHYFDKETGKLRIMSTAKQSASDEIFNQMWWDLKLSLSSSDSSTFSSTPSSWKNWEEARVTYADKRTAWEKGSPDYQGQDSFDNILSHMTSMMLKAKPEAEKTSSKTTESASKATESTKKATESTKKAIESTKKATESTTKTTESATKTTATKTTE